MKTNTYILFIGIAILAVACHSESNNQTVFQSAPVDTTAKKDYSQVVFASKRDTICHMPLTAGIGDTLHFDGKVYGFCSKECKDAFITLIKKEKKL